MASGVFAAFATKYWNNWPMNKDLDVGQDHVVLRKSLCFQYLGSRGQRVTPKLYPACSELQMCSDLILQLGRYITALSPAAALLIGPQWTAVCAIALNFHHSPVFLSRATRALVGPRSIAVQTSF